VQHGPGNSIVVLPFGSEKAVVTRLEGGSNLLDRLRQAMERDPDALVFTFLGDGEQESGRWTYGRLDRESRAMAALLQEHGMAGERALLLLPSSLELVRALYGCLYAGTTFVVSAIPPPRKGTAFNRLLAIAADCRPRAVITTPKLKEAFQAGMAEVPGFDGIRWLTGEDVDPAAEWHPPGLDGDRLAFLQYTSGSTAAPKGVMVSHRNLLANLGQFAAGMALQSGEAAVCWLPLHHDMGLVGMVFGTVYAEMSCVLMSPLHFIQKPVRWLKAISRYRGHVSGGPNFAYDLCLRKVTPEQCEGIDLSSWRVAFNGAEPVRAATLERFAEKFVPFGLRPEALYPCYGLAEATLFVCGSRADLPAVVRTYDIAALQEDRVVPAPAGEGARALVSSGRPWSQDVVIADPESARCCRPGRVGEIWVAGPNVSQGYWQLPEENARTFGARLADEPEAGPFLRTGDLGFVDDGHLFVTGRYKDLIIIAGSNHYPQDIEQTVEEGEPSVRCCAAISVDVGEEERLVVLAEVQRGEALAETARSIRRLVAAEHDLRVHEVELVRPGGVPKTTSGKIQRHACKVAYRNRELARWDAPVEA
jgi:acyl-CoA synthetase (AMP-forming)/AMP-acid ligase II